MTTNDTWHADRDLLRRYAAGDLDPAAAWSLEQHVTGCHDCRRLLTDADAPLVAPARLDAIWAEVEAIVDAPRRTPVERLLVWARVPDHLARLLAATPALTLPWLAAVAMVLGAAALVARRPDVGPLLFLTLAPLAPVAGVALAFGRWSDPTYEIALAAPVRSGRLLLVRAAAVTATSFVLAALAALLLPGLGWLTAAWILPGLAITATTLALSTWWQPLTAALTVATVWLVAVLALVFVADGSMTGFGGSAQAAALVLTGVGLQVVRIRQATFDVARSA